MCAWLPPLHYGNLGPPACSRLEGMPLERRQEEGPSRGSSKRAGFPLMVKPDPQVLNLGLGGSCPPPCRATHAITHLSPDSRQREVGKGTAYLQCLLRSQRVHGDRHEDDHSVANKSS